MDVLNLPVNQTMSRTILTSGTTLLAVLALLLFGGAVILPFAFTMLIGIVVGTYSSIFIASPILLFLEQRYGGAEAEPRHPRCREGEGEGGPRLAGPRARRSRARNAKARTRSARRAFVLFDPESSFRARDGWRSRCFRGGLPPVPKRSSRPAS